MTTSTAPVRFIGRTTSETAGDGYNVAMIQSPGEQVLVQLWHWPSDHESRRWRVRIFDVDDNNVIRITMCRSPEQVKNALQDALTILKGTTLLETEALMQLPTDRPIRAEMYEEARMALRRMGWQMPFNA